jgi:transcription initiation factor TFIIB
MDYKTGEIVCGSCGLVLERMNLDRGTDARVYSRDDWSKIRTGPAESVLEMRGRSTVIDPGGKDARGKKLSPESLEKMSRMRTHDYVARIQLSKDRNLSVALGIIRDLSGKLGLPSHVAEETAVLYRKVLYRGLVRGRSMDCVIAACMYAATRSNPEVKRTLGEFGAAFDIPKKDIGRDYRLVVKEMKYGVKLDSVSKSMQTLCSRLGAEPYLANAAMLFARYLEDPKHCGEYVSGKGPMGLSAAALYILGVAYEDITKSRNSRSRYTQGKLAVESKVTEVTVRNRYKGLTKKLGIPENVEGFHGLMYNLYEASASGRGLGDDMMDGQYSKLLEEIGIIEQFGTDEKVPGRKLYRLNKALF